ncbi:MAG: hypothetical protein ABIP16_09130, partial [Thermomonas sp.]
MPTRSPAQTETSPTQASLFERAAGTPGHSSALAGHEMPNQGAEDQLRALADAAELAPLPLPAFLEDAASSEVQAESIPAV